MLNFEYVQDDTTKLTASLAPTFSITSIVGVHQDGLMLCIVYFRDWNIQRQTGLVSRQPCLYRSTYREKSISAVKLGLATWQLLIQPLIVNIDHIRRLSESFAFRVPANPQVCNSRLPAQGPLHIKSQSRRYHVSSTDILAFCHSRFQNGFQREAIQESVTYHHISGKCLLMSTHLKCYGKLPSIRLSTLRRMTCLQLL